MTTATKQSYLTGDDPDATKLEIDESASIVDMIEEIEALDSFKSLEIYYFGNPHQATKWTSIEAEKMYEALGELDQLESLTLSYTSHLPVRMLRVMLTQTQFQLKHLRLKWILLEEEENDGFAEFAAILRKQQYLQSVELIECQLAPERRDSPVASLDPLIVTLAGLPQLQSLVVQSGHTGSMGSLTRKAIEAACRSSTLQTLDFSAFLVTNHQIVTIVRALGDNRTLQHLYLGDIHMGTHKAVSISSLIHLDSYLKKLHFRLPVIDEQGTARFNGFLIEVANALIQNSSLRELDVGINGRFQIGPRIEKAFAIMLKDNDVLQSLNLNGYRGPSRRTIEFYLRLNRVGRRHLTKNFESVSRSRWLEVLSEASNDLDMLCYLLRMNPSLCRSYHKKSTDSDGHDSLSLLPVSRKRKLQEI